ncbi:MAG: DHS-like NAD/FAD-binding domain-containing protein, partial [Piptocephalis tieghemiana]
FIQKYVVEKEYPLSLLIKVLGLTLPDHIAQLSKEKLMPLFILTLRRHLRKRKKLQGVNSLEDVLGLLRSSKNILVLTGAGVSVSCGIPDFRSPDGIYSRLSEFDLDDPQQMFDLSYFRLMPSIFYSFAKEIYPSNFKPSPSHAFVKLLEQQGQLLRNYTQNIDTLEQAAGIERVLQCHGSFATATCIQCGYHVPGEAISEDIFSQRVPNCIQCIKRQQEQRAHFNARPDQEEDEEEEEMEVGVMKPDIVFFGEKLPDSFDHALLRDRDQVDLLIVMGSSLKVAPVSEIMGQIPHSVPQILINRTPITHMEFDVQLLGESDGIVADLCHRLGWPLEHEKLPKPPSTTGPSLVEPVRYGSHTYLYPGAIFDDDAEEVVDLRDNEEEEEVLNEPIKGHPQVNFSAHHETNLSPPLLPASPDPEVVVEDEGVEGEKAQRALMEKSSQVLPHPPSSSLLDDTVGMVIEQEDTLLPMDHLPPSLRPPSSASPPSPSLSSSLPRLDEEGSTSPLPPSV